jgi:hypothetical protein
MHATGASFAVQDKEAGANITPRTVYFYLVEESGKEHLAAVGEALAEHLPHEFTYKFTEAFRKQYGISSDLINKYNVYEWLKSIILQSQVPAARGMGNSAGHSGFGANSQTFVKHDYECDPIHNVTYSPM